MLVVLMALVTVGVGVGFPLIELLYHLQFIDSEPSIVELERAPAMPNLFGPSLLITGGLWLARQRVSRSTGVATWPAGLLTVCSLYLTITTPIMGDAEHREPFFIRAWDCSAGETPSIMADDALETCTARSIEGSTWLLLESNWPPYDEPVSGIPTGMEGQTVRWESLPDDRFYGVLVTDADQSSYDRIVLFPVWKSELPGRNLDMVPGDLRNGRYPWWGRILFTDNLLGYDAYFFPAGGGTPSATPQVPAKATPSS